MLTLPVTPCSVYLGGCSTWSSEGWLGDNIYSASSWACLNLKRFIRTIIVIIIIGASRSDGIPNGLADFFSPFSAAEYVILGG